MADFKESFNKFNDTPDMTDAFDPQDVEQNKVMGILAYVGILVLVPIFAARESRFARFHANQGLILLITEAAIGLASAVIGAFFGLLGVIPMIGLIFRIIRWTVLLACGFIELACVLFIVLGIFNAAVGKAKELPVIGKFRILK